MNANRLSTNASTRKFIPPHITTIPENAKCVFHGKIFDVYQWPQQLFDGTTATFEMLRRADTVQIVAIKDGKIVLVHERQPHQDWHYGLPGGRNDIPGEDELTAAKRELLEETGMEFASWELIDARQPLRKIDWLVYTFIATDFISQTAQSLDSGEEINVEEIAFDQALQLVKDTPALNVIKTRYRAIREKAPPQCIT